MQKRKGFTLLELMTVVIIIGILAMIAVPQFFKVAERGRAAEGVSLAANYRDAQLRYSSQYGNTTSTESDLDISMSDPKYFSVSLAEIEPASSPNGAVATITRNSESNPGYSYTFTASYNGSITCASSGSACTDLGLD